MKKVKLTLALLVALVTLIFSGCTASNDIKITEEGQGRQEFKFAFDKALYGEEFVKVSSINDIANIIKANMANKNVVITADTKSSTTKDFIVASIEYNSLEELDSIIKDMGLELNSFGMDEDFTDVDASADADVEEEEEAYITVLKEYFSVNGIAYNAESEGFKKFVKAFEKALEFDYEEEYTEDEYEILEEDIDTQINDMFSMFEDEAGDEALFLEEDFPKTMIVKGTDSSQLKIGAGTIQILPVYVMASLFEKLDSIVDIDGMMNQSFEAMYQEIVAEEKAEYTELFKTVDLAKLVKDVMNTDVATEVTCNIDTITDEQLGLIFTADVVKTMNDVYYGEEDSEEDYEEDYMDEDYFDEEYAEEDFLGEDFLNMDFDVAMEDGITAIVEELFENYKCTIEFGKQKVALATEDLEGDEEGYIVIDSEKGLLSSGANKVNNTVGIDDTPKTGDGMQLLWLGAIVMLAAAGAVYFYRVRKAV